MGLTSYPSTVLTIANGATLSGNLDAAGMHIVGIAMPAAWTAASLGFDVSFDDAGTWLQVRDSNGLLIALTVNASEYIALPPALLPTIGLMRLRASVAQGAARSIRVVHRVYA